MTEKIDNARRPDAHPDLTLIAAHADRRLAGEERARMDQHLAQCSRCFEIYSETLLFKEDTEPQPKGGSRAIPFLVRRRSFQIAAGLAAALVLAAGLSLVWNRSGFRVLPASPVAELVQAVGERRLVEPRLTGGFRYGRLLVMRSGEGPQGLDAQPPAVLAAVARIRERAEKDPSPEALGALGVTYLVSGDVGAAVKALESATAQKTDDPRLWSDLAAAYLARARQADEPADIPKALEAAERAIELTDPPVEAWFNRALALEALHLDDAAKKAWEDYVARDATSGWADEARQHLEALAAKPRQSSVEEERARVRAALEEGSAAVGRLADESPQMLRDYLDDVALPGWAEAQLLGHPDAGVHREHATVMGEALVRTTTDVMVRDTARALAEPVSATSRDPLRSQAQGFAAYFEAKRNHEQQLPSCPQFQEAYRALESGGSPYAAWPRLFFIYCSFAENTDAVADGLESLRLIAEQRGYVQLLGRVQWLEGLSDAFRASLTASMERYRLARASFQTTQDVQSETVILGLLAEDELVLGERRGAWRDRLSSLARLDQVRSATWRYTLLTAAARACVEEERPRSARHFASALVEAAVKSFGPVLASESLVRRADIHHAIGSGDLALADLGAARRWIDQIADKVRADRRSAEVDATEGKVLADSRPAEAAPLIERALKYFASTAPARVPPLRLLSARALIGVGRNDDAEKDLAAGIEALERQSASVKDAAQQITFFDQALPLFDDMVRLQVTRHHDPERGLAFTERSRARQLGRSLGGSGFAPFDPESLREILPEGLALVYYMPLADRLFEWALTRGGTHFVERPVTRAKLSQMVAAHRAAIERRAPADVLRQPAGRLHDELVRPLLPFLGAQRVLVFVPDAMLQSLAFSSLWDRKLGRYLVEDYLLAVAPSGSVFVQASKGAIALGPSPRAFVIGNPLVDRGVGAAFPNLPGAEAEAVEIAGLYPSVTLLVGKEATKAQFLRGVAGSQVVHYAGHASSSELNPLAARLLLARDQGNGDSGSLLLRDLDRQSFVRTRLVVLAACRTAAGAASGVEGALSLARPFLAAGVPAVVATLWEIDDAVSRRLLVDFHRALLEGQDPADALRSAQTALIRSSDPSFSHPVNWAAFTYLGGLDFHSLPKGVIS